MIEKMQANRRQFLLTTLAGMLPSVTTTAQKSPELPTLSAAVLKKYYNFSLLPEEKNWDNVTVLRQEGSRDNPIVINDPLQEDFKWKS